MAKKSLIFMVIVVVSIIAILCLVGWTRTHQKDEAVKRKVKLLIPQKQQEIRVVAVEEKLAPIKQKPKKERKKDVSKNKQPPLPKKIIVKAKKNERIESTEKNGGSAKALFKKNTKARC